MCACACVCMVHMCMCACVCVHVCMHVWVDRREVIAHINAVLLPMLQINVLGDEGKSSRCWTQTMVYKLKVILFCLAYRVCNKI